MEKYGPVILYFLLGVVVGYIGMSFSKNVGKGNPHRTSTFKTVGSNDFYYNPKLDDVYFITDTLSSERTALYTFGITNDSITFAKIVNLDNFSFESVVTLIYQSRSDKMTMYNNLDRRLKTIAIDQLSPDFLWEQGKSLRIYRIYPTTKVTSTLLAFSSPIGLIIILISFVIIWFGSTIKDLIDLPRPIIADTVYIVLLISFFYNFNPVYFTSSSFAILFSIFSIVPIYLFFQRFKKSLFRRQSWLLKESYKFILLFLFGSLFQLLFYTLCIKLSFFSSKDPFNYIDDITPMVIDGTGLLWLFIAIGNFLNNARKYLVDTKYREQESQYQAQQSKAELDALQSKVNPHFLYNSLNSIAGLAQENPAKTEEMAIALSHFYKQSTNRQGEHWNTIEEALELLQTYLGIEKIRFGDRLQFDIQYPEFLKQEKIPRFLIQPLVENAIKYGYQASTNSMTIRLELEKVDNQLLIRLFDQGPPFPDNLQSGYGVQSVQKKLELLYPDLHELAFINLPEKHVIITLFLKTELSKPLKKMTNTHYLNNPKESYLSIAIKYGVIGILISNVATYIMYKFGMLNPDNDMLVDILSLVLTVAPIALAIYAYQVNQLTRTISFRQAFGVGFMTTLVLAIPGGIFFNYIFLEMIAPSLKSIMPDTQLTLFDQTIGYAIICTIFGTLSSLVLAAFMRSTSIDKCYL